MKKQVVTVLAVATLGLGTSVSAEEIVTAPEKAPESDTQVKSVKPVTEADVKASEIKVIEAGNATASQKEVVAKVEADMQTAETAVLTAQAEVAKAEALVKEATPEAVEAVKAAIIQTETALPEADKAIVMAEEEVTKEETAVSDQETVVSTVKADLSAKEEAVAEAKADVDKAQALLDGTNQASVVAEADQAKEALAIAQSNLVNAEADLVKAKEADAKRAKAISDLTAKVGTAQADLSAKKEALSQANTKAEKTGTALTKANSSLAEAKAKVDAINTITLTPEYVKALKDYVEHYSEKGDEAKAILDGLAETHRAMNKFKANPADEGVVLDTNNLSEDVMLDLSNFVSDLINQIRKAFGNPETVVTPSAIRFADLVTDGYVLDDWTWENVRAKGHDEKAIAKAAREVGLKDDRQYYENLNSYNMSHSQLSLSDAKARIHKSIIDFMFNGWEYLHAESIAGFQSAGLTYLGVDLSARTGTTGVHVIQVDDTHILDKTKFDKTPITNPYDSQSLKQAYDVAQANFAKAKEVDDKAKAEKFDAEMAYTNSQATLNQANQELAEVEVKEILTPLAQNKRDIAKEKQIKALDRNQKAQTALANLSADVKVKQEALVKAKEALAGKLLEKANVSAQLALEETKLSDLVALVKDKKDSLTTAQKAKETLETKLSDHKAHLERLTNAPKVLETAKRDLVKAKEHLEKAVATLEQEVKTLKDLEAKEAEIRGQHAKVVEAYQAVLEARHQAELERQKAKIEKSGQVVVPVVNSKGQLVSYMADKKPIPVSTVAKTSVSNSVTKEKMLPKTNDSSGLITLFGAFLLGFGAFWLRKKQD